MIARLADLTTIRVGGPPRDLLVAESRESIIEAATGVWATGEPLLVVGGGSNLLVSDEGFDGSALRIMSRGFDSRWAQAGEPWDAVVERAVADGLAGIEALSGIPGSAGAAPIQNIGAYGQELSDTLVSVELLEPDGTVTRVPAAELELGYRTSSLRAGRPGIVLAVELDLQPGDSVVQYEQLAKSLGIEVGERAPVADVRRAVLALRRSKGMVLDPDDPDSVSCGSFFTNPIVGENFARGLPHDPPWYLQDDDESVKLSAAWLIERSGITKGFALPGSRAAISSKHTLAIVNRGGATAEEVAELARFVQARVAAEFGVELQPEPILVDIQL